MTRLIKDMFPKMEGSWTGINRIWYEPNGKLNHEGSTEETIQFILDGKFLLHSTKTEMDEKVIEGSRVISFIESRKKFKSSWIDSFHNGTDIMIQEGFDTEKLSVTGSYSAGGMEWGWRTEFKMISDNELIISHFNKHPDQEEYLGVESKLTRK